MMRRVHLVVFAVLIALGSGSLRGAAPGRSVSAAWCATRPGFRRLAPQVQLLRPDLSVIASVYTDANGRYLISSVLPGRYAVKAMGAWFLPSLRENVRVRANTVVNLTLNSLYEVMQWLPAEPRAGNAQKDDWAWTLRSAANRPLLRWLEDGPLVVVSDGSGAHPRLKARLMATGQEGAFGESGERISAAVEETPSNSRELLASVDFDSRHRCRHGVHARLPPGSGLCRLGAVGGRRRPPSGDRRRREPRGWTKPPSAVGRRSTWATSSRPRRAPAQVLARLCRTSPQTVVAAAALCLRGLARWQLHHSLSHDHLPARRAGCRRDARPAPGCPRSLPATASWPSSTDCTRNSAGSGAPICSGVAVLVFADRIDNPVIEAMSHFAAGNSAAAAVLLDPTSGLIHAAGPSFSTAGMSAIFEHRLPGGNHFRLSYANGDALVLLPASSPQSASLAQLLAGAHPRRAQEYALSLSGTLDGTRTRWRASYRWQPEDTVTQVAPFAADAAAP